MPFASNGSQAVHYRIAGVPEAPPLLLLMGLGLSLEAWGALAEKLARRFRVIALDNRGTGQSSAPRRPCTMAQLADDALAVLDVAGVSCANVFGISMGGMVAQELALRHPGRVSALALGATFASYARSEKPSLNALVDLLLLNCGDRFATSERVGRLLVSDSYRERAFGWISSDAGQVRGVLPILFQLAAVARHGPAERLRELRVPTLVISGDADRVIPVENAHRLAALIPGARLVVLSGVGHAFPLEREDETVELLAEHFLGARGDALAPAV
jgi:pimeloyl-ACP methyl ester carboxylesterase